MKSFVIMNVNTFVKNRNVCIHVVLLFDDNISETDSYEYLFNISTDTATEVRLYMLYEWQ